MNDLKSILAISMFFFLSFFNCNASEVNFKYTDTKVRTKF